MIHLLQGVFYKKTLHVMQRFFEFSYLEALKDSSFLTAFVPSSLA